MDRQVVSPSFDVGSHVFKFIVTPATGRQGKNIIKTSKGKDSFKSSKGRGKAVLKILSGTPLVAQYKIWSGVMNDEGEYPFMDHDFIVHTVTPPSQPLDLQELDLLGEFRLFCCIANIYF